MWIGVFLTRLHQPKRFSFNLLKQQTMVRRHDLFCCLHPIRWHCSISLIPNLFMIMFWIFSLHKFYVSFGVSYIPSIQRLLRQNLSFDSISFDETSFYFFILLIFSSNCSWVNSRLFVNSSMSVEGSSMHSLEP